MRVTLKAMRAEGFERLLGNVGVLKRVGGRECSSGRVLPSGQAEPGRRVDVVPNEAKLGFAR
jgi:hypothetical protein